jgi:hypothetical protein
MEKLDIVGFLLAVFIKGNKGKIGRCLIISALLQRFQRRWGADIAPQCLFQTGDTLA